MLRVRYIVTGRYAVVIPGLLKANEKLVEQASRTAFKEIQPKLENDLRTTPGIPSSPFRWSDNAEANARAKRWWFKAIADGRVKTDGQHYVRSGNLGKSFKVALKTIRRDRLRTELSIASNARDKRGRFTYRWVIGTFDKRRGVHWQIPGHKNTGWWRLKDVTDRRFEEYSNRVSDIYIKTDIRKVAG